MDGGNPKTWSLQDAKNHFSEVVRAAERDGPQVITRHGKTTAIILSAEEYDRLKSGHSKPHDFVKALLAMPQGGDDEIWDNLRQPFKSRDIEF